MRKIVFESPLSLDGFTEGPDGALDWLLWENRMFDVDAFTSQFDTVFYGRKAYERFAADLHRGATSNNHALFMTAISQMRKYVFSRSEKHVRGNGMVVASNLEEQVRRVVAEDGKDIWFGGGADILRSFVELDLIDEYIFRVHPVVLGEGKPLFSGINGQLKLRLISERHAGSGVMVLRYQPQTRIQNRYPMVEVFRTNVQGAEVARTLITVIEATFADYKANFDLEDCDHILRVQALRGRVHASQLIRLLKSFGFEAEVLSDDVPEIAFGAG
jgi:dihydrofolate reductase